MYQYIFDIKSIIITIFTTITLIVIISILKKNIFFPIRLPFINFVPFFALGYYISIFLGGSFSDDILIKIIFSTLIEFLIFFYFVRFTYKFINKKRLQSLKFDLAYYNKTFFVFIFILISIFLYLVLQSNFGFFSTSSRIKYLIESRTNLYLTYFSGFLGSFLTVALLNYAYLYNKLDVKNFIAFFLLNMVTSILSGSKGGFILWLISFISFISFNRHVLRKIFLAILIIVILIYVQVLFFKMYSGLESNEVISLMIMRLFLTNDGRALSLDYTSPTQGLEYFFRNTFRSLSNLLGFPPTDKAIGFVLYENHYKVTDIGSNGSLTSLMNYYISNDFIELIFVTILVICIFIIYVQFVIYLNKYFRETIFNGAGYFLCIQHSVLFSQDILAFQLMLYFYLLLMIFIFLSKLRIRSFLYDLKYNNTNTKS